MASPQDGSRANTTIRIAIKYPATASDPKLDTIRTRMIQLAVPISTWTVPVPERRSMVRITAGLRVSRERWIATRASPRHRRYSWYSTPVPRPSVVAIAAPVTPSRGNGPTPKIRQGPSAMLMPFASHSTRIAIAASPAPRKIALMRKSIRMTTLPPSMMRV